MPVVYVQAIEGQHLLTGFFIITTALCMQSWRYWEIERERRRNAREHERARRKKIKERDKKKEDTEER